MGLLFDSQGIRSEDRTFAEGFAPMAEAFYGTRVKVRLPNGGRSCRRWH